MCVSLREAQAVLLRNTLSRRGSGDKMAALLMKHVEKEKKKLLAVTPFSSSSNSSSSSSVKTSVKTFHTQKGQYTVHFGAAAGQSAHTSRRRASGVSFKESSELHRLSALWGWFSCWRSQRRRPTNLDMLSKECRYFCFMWKFMVRFTHKWILSALLNNETAVRQEMGKPRNQVTS